MAFGHDHRPLYLPPPPQFTFDAYDNEGAASVLDTASTVNLDTVRRNGADWIFDLTDDALTINDTNIYNFSFRLTIGSPGDNEITAWLERCPAGGSYAEVDGTTCMLGGLGNVDPLSVVAEKSGSYTATSADQVIIAAGTFTIALPTSVGLSGREYTVKNASTGVITLEGDGSETIDDAANIVLSQHETVTVVSDNANWWVI